MFQPNDHVAAHVDDYLHSLLSEADAAHVRKHCETCPVCKEALEQAERRKKALEAVPPEKAPEPLIQETVTKAEPPAVIPIREDAVPVRRRTPPQPKPERVPLMSKKFRRYLYSTVFAVAASVAIILTSMHLYYTRLEPTPYELSLLGQRQLLAGAPGSMRVRVTNHQTRQPVPNVPVDLELLGQGEVVKLANFTTDGQGTGTPRFTLPDWPDGTYKMRVRAKTEGRDEKLESMIELKRSWRLMLSTDKPVYQPGQTILMRSLGLRKPDLKPVAGQNAVFTITDPKGTMIFKQRTVTSKYGITAAECPLATEILEGQYTITCTVGDSSSKSTVDVKKYVLPKFKIVTTLDKPYYQPGQRANITVQADYFFGKPVAGGEISLFLSSGGQHLTTLEGKTDETGKTKFEYLLPQRLIGREQDGGDARLTVLAMVKDTAEQKQSAQVSRLVTTQPLKVEIIPEAGRIVPGLDNTIYLWASYADGQPAANARVAVTGSEKELTTNALGLVSFVIPAAPNTVQIAAQVTDAEGRKGGKSVTLSSSGSVDFICRPDKAVYDGSSTVKLTALGSGTEPVFVDFLKDGQTLLTEVIPMTNGKGELAFDLPAELFGTIEICAYRYQSASGLPVKQTRIIYVRQARQLQIAAAMDHKEYRPGGKAKLNLTLTDDKGKPTAGAISLAAVDEAVYAVLEQAPGMEKVFFLLEQELLKPVYAIYPWAPDLFNAQPEERQEFDRALFSRTVTTNNVEDQETRNRFASLHTMILQSFTTKVQEITEERTSGLAWTKQAWFTYGTAALAIGALLFFVWLYETLGPKGFFAVLGGLILLAIGGTLVVAVLFLGIGCTGGVKSTGRFSNVGGSLSAGGDGGVAWRRDSTRELEDRAPPMPAPRGGRNPMPMAAPDMAPTKDAPVEKADKRAVKEEAPTPRVREWFPETLLWRPEVVTNDQGMASVEVELADSITTWRLLASAVSGQGQLGSFAGAVRVFQPFFCDLNLPVAMTRNDEVAVPVVVYNYLNKPQTVQLTLNKENWFTLLDQEKKSIDLAPGEVKGTSFRLRVQQVGRHTLQATALGSGVSDALKKEIEVLPDGLRQERIVNGTMLQPVDTVLNLPANAIPGSGKLILKFYPSTFSQLVEGLEGIFRQPYGCFEQTSSTTYPNVLALEYLRRTNKSVPQVEARAKQYINLGYQRLVGFEVSGGGFDWFGRPPANVTLTAYGLMEFEDMAKVHDVDPNLIQRTRRWLLQQRRADGSWQPTGGMFHDEFHRRMQNVGTTAYVAWAVFGHAETKYDAQPTWRYLLSHRPENIDDAYTLALICNAFLAMDPTNPEVKPYLAKLESLKQTTADGKQVFWGVPTGRRTQFYGAGQSANVEATALAVLAFMKANIHPGTTKAALTWLTAQKDGNGTWHGTQGTVLALKALIAGTGASLGGDQARKIELILNDGDRREITIPADQAEVMQQLDLSHLLRSGENRLRISEPMASGTGFQIAFWHHVPGNPANKPQEPLGIFLDYDRTQLKVNDTVTVKAAILNRMNETAPMVMLDLPIPAGFRPQTEDFTAMKEKGQIAKFQVTPRSVTVYLLSLTPNQRLELTYRLQATMPVKLQAPGGTVYEYYQREKRSTSPVVPLVVE
jgi:anti-sigma factor RsiW